MERAVKVAAAFLMAAFLVKPAHSTEITFGVVPQQAAAKLARLWAPLLREIEGRSGVKLAFRTAPNIPTFEERVRRGEYDVAYMNPYHFVVFSETNGYKALAKRANVKIKGIIVVHKNSTATDLNSLQGARLSFPAPAAFAASVLPRAELRKQGISFTPQYVSSHDSVYRSVAKGLFPAGGGIVRTLNNVDPKTRNELRILWTTNGYTPHAIATHPRISADVRRKLLDAMVNLNEDDLGRRLLESLKFKGIEPASDDDWDDVRALQLTELKS